MVLADEPGLKSDTCSLTLVKHQLELPKTGKKLKISRGYKKSGVYDMGAFEIDGCTLTHKELQITAHVTPIARPTSSLPRRECLGSLRFL